MSVLHSIWILIPLEFLTHSSMKFTVIDSYNNARRTYENDKQT